PPRDLDFARNRSNQLLSRCAFPARNLRVDVSEFDRRCAKNRIGHRFGGRLMPNAVAVAISIGWTVAVTIRMSVLGFARGVAKSRCGDRGRHAAESQAYFSSRSRLARVAAAEDDVFHLVAAKALRALLTHHPGDGVGDVALAASVRSDDRGHSAIERELRPIRK